MAIGLRTDIADSMRRAVGVAVRMTIEAGDATARFLGTPILGLVELLAAGTASAIGAAPRAV